MINLFMNQEIGMRWIKSIRMWFSKTVQMCIKYPSIIYWTRLFGFILPIGVIMHLYLAVFQAGANLIYQVIFGSWIEHATMWHIVCRGNWRILKKCQNVDAKYQVQLNKTKLSASGGHSSCETSKSLSWKLFNKEVQLCKYTY